MFGKLRDKLKGWLGKPEEEKPSKAKKKEKKSKVKQVKEKKAKIKPTKSKKEKKSKNIEPAIEEVKEIIREDKEAQEITKEEKIVEQEITSIEEQPKQSFFSKLFKKKIEETKAQVTEDEIEAPLEAPETQEEKKESFFSKLASKITSAKITESDFEDIFQDLEIILLENNVALDVVDKIREDLKKEMIGKDAKRSEIEKTVLDTLKTSISEVLIEPPDLIDAIKSSHKPYTIIFFGINGTGKTTSIAKLAHKLKENNISCVLAAADTFRAAAIQQLETHANKLGVPIIKHDYGADPTAVAFDAKKYAQVHGIKCVLIDTAGRMYTKENLIKQMEKIIRVIQPDLKVFVGESITGNDAIDQVKTFNDAVGIDGIILSKADVDEKGGTALSVSYVTGKPIYFLGVGQQYSDLQDFKKSIILKNLGLD